MRFRTGVTRCIWNESSSMRTMHLMDLDTGRNMIHVCSILFSATGALIKPNPCDIPDNDTFKGYILHSARWRHDVNLTYKYIVVVGNGCRHYAQKLTNSDCYGNRHCCTDRSCNCTGSWTQIVWSKHWVFPSHNISYPKFLV